jgi:hypothetical protein
MSKVLSILREKLGTELWKRQDYISI